MSAFPQADRRRATRATSPPSTRASSIRWPSPSKPTTPTKYWSSTDVTREPSNITATQESPAFRRNCPVASKVRNGGANSTRNADESKRKPLTPYVTPTIRPPARSPTSFKEHDAGRIVAGDVRGIEQNTRKNETRRVRNRKDQRRRLSQWSRGRQESLLAHKTSMTIEHIDESWSSKTCPACQTRNHPNGRGYHCHNCGFTCNRDAVGAINILIRAENGSYQPMDTNKTVQCQISPGHANLPTGRTT